MHCKDQKGLVADVTTFLARHNGNILELDQHVDKHRNVFFMRIEWDLSLFDLQDEEIAPVFLKEIAEPKEIEFQLHFSREVPRMAIFVSKATHCLHDILARYDSGDWRVEIPLVISNHADAGPVAKKYGVPFHQFNISAENKAESESEQLELLNEHRIDFMVLARYMQVLSNSFVSRFPARIINIHHSFLPAFPGARPYQSAYHRGVKIIGATSHYVTAELDAGPIIEQDVINVNHKHSVDDLVRKGRDLEKIVLSRAVWHHLKRRTLVFENRTIVFQ